MFLLHTYSGLTQGTVIAGYLAIGASALEGRLAYTTDILIVVIVKANFVRRGVVVKLVRFVRDIPNPIGYRAIGIDLHLHGIVDIELLVRWLWYLAVDLQSMNNEPRRLVCHVYKRSSNNITTTIMKTMTWKMRSLCFRSFHCVQCVQCRHSEQRASI